MSGEEKKLVFRNAEERELWREACLTAVHANAQMASLIVSKKVKELDPHEEADAAVLAYRERCGESASEPTRDEGPWAVWIPRLKQWRGYECDGWYVVASAVAFFNRLDAEAERARFDRETAEGESIVAPFPRTRAEFERGPGAVDTPPIGGGA